MRRTDDCLGRSFQRGLTEPRASSAAPPGGTCSGHGGITRTRWRASRMCARPCGHTPCSTDPLDVITAITVGIIVATSLLLFGFGVNLLYLTWRATRLRPRPHAPAPRGNEPRVCVQVPIYNERYVAQRVLDAVSALAWPRER